MTSLERTDTIITRFDIETANLSFKSDEIKSI